MVQGLYKRISTSWKRKHVLPESTSSYTLDLLEIPGFEMSELPFSPASGNLNFDAPFWPCFKFFFGVLFPFVLKHSTTSSKCYITNRKEAISLPWVTYILNGFLIEREPPESVLFNPSVLQKNLKYMEKKTLYAKEAKMPESRCNDNRITSRCTNTQRKQMVMHSKGLFPLIILKEKHLMQNWQVGNGEKIKCWRSLG